MSSDHNIVLDKIRCVYEINYERGTNAATVVSDAPVFDTSQPLHVSLKLDGECCWFESLTGRPMRRRDIKSSSKAVPADWIRTGEPDNNGHTIGFLPIQTDPSAKYMREHAIDYAKQEAVVLNNDMRTTRRVSWIELAGQTVEFMGPKVQGNPSKLDAYCFYIHGDVSVPQEQVPLHSYAALRQHMLDEESQHGRVFEGYVVRVIASGQLFKITRKHLGLTWKGK